MRPPRKAKPGPKPPPPGPAPAPDPAAAQEEAAISTASSAMMTAAATLISQMFVIASERMEEAVKDKLPDDNPAKVSTRAMILQLQAQLNRALGVTPEDGMPSKPGKEP